MNNLNAYLHMCTFSSVQIRSSSPMCIQSILLSTAAIHASKHIIYWFSFSFSAHLLFETWFVHWEKAWILRSLFFSVFSLNRCSVKLLFNGESVTFCYRYPGSTINNVLLHFIHSLQFSSRCLRVLLKHIAFYRYCFNVASLLSSVHNFIEWFDGFTGWCGLSIIGQSEDGADQDSPEEGTPASSRTKRRVGRPGRKRKQLLPVSTVIMACHQPFML